MRLVDENTPIQDDEDATQGEGDQVGDDTPNVEEEEVPLQRDESGDKRIKRKR